jgi:hypothetical protein
MMANEDNETEKTNVTKTFFPQELFREIRIKCQGNSRRHFAIQQSLAAQTSGTNQPPL